MLYSLGRRPPGLGPPICVMFVGYETPCQLCVVLEADLCCWETTTSCHSALYSMLVWNWHQLSGVKKAISWCNSAKRCRGSRDLWIWSCLGWRVWSVLAWSACFFYLRSAHPLGVSSVPFLGTFYEDFSPFRAILSKATPCAAGSTPDILMLPGSSAPLRVPHGHTLPSFWVP